MHSDGSRSREQLRETTRGLELRGFRLGEWTVRPTRGRLRGGGKRKHLSPQQMVVLVELAVRAGEVVSKEELLESVWDGAAVEEGALARCVSELRSALGDDAKAPRYIQTIPTRGYRLIAGVEPEEPDAGRSWRKTGWWAAAAVAVVALLGWWVVREGDDEAANAGAVGSGPSVAVLGFRDLSKDPELAWLATALPELLASELLQSADLRVVPAESVLRMTQELSIPEAASLAPETLARVGGRLGAEYVVLGSYVGMSRDDGGLVRVDVRIQDVPSGETTLAWAQTGSTDEALDLVVLAGTQLREALGGENWIGGDREAVPHLSGDPEALRLYFEGTRRLRQFDAVQAKELLEESLAIDADQPFGWLAVSQAWAAMGYDAKAIEAADKAVELSEGLPREYRLWIEAHALTTASKWDEAIEIYKALRLFSPENAEYGLLLAGALNRAGEPEEAILLLNELDKGAGAQRSDPRVPLILARSRALVGDHRGALEATRRAVDSALVEGAHLVVAQARHAEASSLHALGEVAAARLALDEAMKSFKLASDHRSEARAHLTLAAWDEKAGHFNAAHASLATAQEIYRSTSDQAGKAAALAATANLLSAAGQVMFAEQAYRESIALFRETADKAGEANALFGLGNLFGRRARPDVAAPLYENALEIYSEIGSRERVALTQLHLGKLEMIGAYPTKALQRMRNAEKVFADLGLQQYLHDVWTDQGQLLFNLGDLDAAEMAFAKGLHLATRTDNDRSLFVGRIGIGRVQKERAQLREARVTFEQVLAEETKGERSRGIVPARAFLANVLMELDEFEAAELMARKAVEEARAIEYFVASAVRYLGWVLIERENYQEAETVLGDELARDLGLIDSSLELRIVHSRLLARVGSRERAKGVLRGVIGEASQRNYWQIEAEALLVLGEVELMFNGVGAGIQILQTLEAEASSKGWELIASKARRLLAEHGAEPVVAASVARVGDT